MTKAKASAKDPQSTIVLDRTPGESDGQALARTIIGPSCRHAGVALSYGANMLGPESERPSLMDCTAYIREHGENAAAGDMALASHLLAAQAVTLDTMFTALASRTFSNIGQYSQTAERYGRLALKAQANSRATLEALAKLHQPREQTVRHVHVGQGGQAVVADEFHHHAGATENGKGVEQCHAAAAPGASPALPGPDQIGDAMPIPGRVGKAAMSDARGQ